jgi:hypothetical protein
VRNWLKRQSAGPNAAWLLARVGRQLPVQRTPSSNRYVRTDRFSNPWRNRETAAA